MALYTPPPFLAALQDIMKTGIAAVALSEQDVFFLANDQCLKPDRIPYAKFREFTAYLDASDKVPLDTLEMEMLYEVYCYLRAEKLRQKLAMLNAIAEGKPNWRRYCWLLDMQVREERIKNAKAKEEEKEAKKAAKQQQQADTAEPLDPDSPKPRAAQPLSIAHGGRMDAYAGNVAATP